MEPHHFSNVSLNIPAGSRANPSRWGHRLPLIIAATVGLAIAAYLASYQSGAFSHIWEPFFGNGSNQILHSSLARALPIPDAALGAAAYLAEVITGLIGGEGRWHREPWLVLLYGLIVLGLGIGSIFLVIMQGAYFHAWCTLCLCSAAISIGILLTGWAEPLASYRYVRREMREGHSLKQALLQPGILRSEYHSITGGDQ